MKNEERDIYTIPPNFIEGGTLMGGMFKTRNVIEAGVLAVLIGGPVLYLHLSLTVRIIILCLTALPLTMVALIGINGNSLSSFFIQLFSFLRNRRMLSADESVDVPKKKTILPSWSKHKQTTQENVEETVFSHFYAEELLEMLDRLNTRDREVIYMRHVDRMSYAEMAKALHMKEGTVRTALLRAKQRLKKIDVKEKEASQHEPGDR